MDKGKMIPLIISSVLFIIAIFIFVRNQKNNEVFDKLIVTYKNQNSDYKDIKVDDVIVVDKVSFWVVSTIKESIVLHSSETLIEDNKESNEFEITLNKSKKVCFQEQECIVFNLI